MNDNGARLSPGGLRPPVPAWWEEPARRVAEKVRARAPSCPGAFVFATDLHVPSNCGSSGALFARLAFETGVRTVLCGGDIPEAFGSKAELEASIAAYREKWVARAESGGCDFYPVHGNHDFTIRASAEENDGWTFESGYTRETLLDTAAVRRDAVVFDGAPGVCAYYFDRPEARLRTIVADTSDSVTRDRPFWGVVDGIGREQLLWLAREALGSAPDSWGVAIVQHCPMFDAAVASDREVFAPWKRVVDAYRRRRAVDVCGETVDFSSAGARVLFVVAGHHHAERAFASDGLWHLEQPCDAAYFDYVNRSGPGGPKMPEKVAGTATEQTLDVVQADQKRGLLFLTRLGGGFDRTFHLEPLRAKAGQTVAAPRPETLGGRVSWDCYDSDFVARHDNPDRKYDYFVEGFRNVAEVSMEGAVTAKKAGESVVFATAPDGRREFYAVLVEDR